MDASIIIMLAAMAGAGVLSVPMARMLKISNLVRASSKQRHGDLNRTVHDLVGLAEIREKHSLVVMAQSAATMKDPLLVRGVTLALEGQNSHAIRTRLEESYLGAQPQGGVGGGELVRSVCTCLALGLALVCATQLVLAANSGEVISPVTGALAAAAVFTGLVSSVVSRSDWTAASSVRQAELLRRLIVVEGVVSLAEGLDAAAMRRRLTGLMPGHGAWGEVRNQERKAA